MTKLAEENSGQSFSSGVWFMIFLVIILVVILVLTVGYFFWRNFYLTGRGRELFTTSTESLPPNKGKVEERTD